jgi:hypothetical protein
MSSEKTSPKPQVHIVDSEMKKLLVVRDEGRCSEAINATLKAFPSLKCIAVSP